MTIIPAIIPKSFVDFEDKINAVVGVADFIQVDVCDGKFVSSKSWPFVEDDGDFEKIVSEEKGLPRWEDIDFEIHIMAETPEDEVTDWVKAGASRIIIHIEAGSDKVENIIEEWGKVAEIGIAINLKTPLSVLTPFFDKVKVIQLMAIENVGFQGQMLDEEIFNRIRQLRIMAPKNIISVDGGVNLNNAKELINAGVDRLVVGSAIFEDGIVSENLKDFQMLNE